MTGRFHRAAGRAPAPLAGIAAVVAARGRRSWSRAIAPRTTSAAASATPATRAWRRRCGRGGAVRAVAGRGWIRGGSGSEQAIEQQARAQKSAQLLAGARARNEQQRAQCGQRRAQPRDGAVEQR